MLSESVAVKLKFLVRSDGMLLFTRFVTLKPLVFLVLVKAAVLVVLAVIVPVSPVFVVL